MFFCQIIIVTVFAFLSFLSLLKKEILKTMPHLSLFYILQGYILVIISNLIYSSYLHFGINILSIMYMEQIKVVQFNVSNI
jgi:hypothetical protein